MRAGRRMTETPLRLRWLSYPVTALGPGRRVVLWVAGCPLRCPGCITKELQDPGSGRALPISQVLPRILDIPHGLDGITLTGGEPFEQAAALAQLLEALADARPEWNVLVYSGHPLARLRLRGAAVQHLLARTDILVAGPYLESRPAVHPLGGSGNQLVHYLSGRGRGLRARCERLPPGRMNLGTGRRGKDLLIGILPPADRTRAHHCLGLRREGRVHG